MELSKKRARTSPNACLYPITLSLSGLFVLFALLAQPIPQMLEGFLQIQLHPAALITDPICIGGIGAALLNAGLMLLGSTLLIKIQRIPFTGMTIACLFTLTGFSLLGKNLLNSCPILLGGALYARYEREPFSKYIYISLFSTCLSPLVSHFMILTDITVLKLLLLSMGVLIGFVMPPICSFTVRIHQGYNLYNVGFAGGFVGLALVSLLRACGMDFSGRLQWSSEYGMLLLYFMCIVLLGLFALGMLLGCRSVRQYLRILTHSGRAVTDFVLLEGVGAALTNMALVGLIGLLYLIILGVPLNGPLMCALFTMIGFGAFGKHPRSVVPVMAGAILAALLLPEISLTAPGVLLAALFCTGLSPIAGQFGALWGIVAGALHMCIVQNTSALYAGMNLYNNGFAIGLTCVILIPLIEALKSEPED